MLDLDLDLEADLGIDTVKQAELFATIRTNYDIPRREDLRLAEYNTLKKVVGFVCDALGDGKDGSGHTPTEKSIQRFLRQLVAAFHDYLLIDLYLTKGSSFSRQQPKMNYFTCLAIRSKHTRTEAPRLLDVQQAQKQRNLNAW